ncbi:MAG: glutaredoxin family protein [Deltaproteobacteria bacterium]|nr:glutaredoxin family protein [Deltaproteobacteria bacterium]
MLALILYTRPDCHLCAEMKEVVARVARDFPHTFTEIDISGKPELESRFGLEVPVLLVNGRKAFKYRVAARELRDRLKREGQGRGQWTLFLPGRTPRG